MKKLISVLMIVFCGVLFIGCGAPKLSDDFNEEDLKTASEEIIGYLNDGEYEKIVDMSSPELEGVLTKEVLEDAYTGLESHAGKYESISKFVFQEKDGQVIIAVIAKYSESKVQFTLAFNKDMQLVGIHMK